MELTYEEVIALKESGEKNVWVVLSDKYGRSKDSIRSWFNRERVRRQAFEALLDNENSTEPEVPVVDKEFPAEKQTIFDDDGNVRSISSKRVIAMDAEQEKSVEFVLRAHGFEPSEWTVVNLINNMWQGMRKNDMGAITLYQSKLTVKPKSENKQISFADVQYFFDNLSTTKIASAKTRVDKDGGLTLLINLADAHFGNNTDDFSVREAVLNLVSEVRYRTSNANVKEIVLVNLGDLLNIDGYSGQTTSGTQVGSRGEFYGVWEEATKTIIESIESLSEIAPVRYISINGNHDAVSSFTASKAVEYYFTNDLNVSFDCDFEERKYIEIGKSLFGFVHGDVPKQNISTFLQREAKEAYGRSWNAYLLLGHVHHINMLDKDGVIVMHLPTLTVPDSWHKKEGYTGSWKGTYCFLVDDLDGIVETWHIKSEQ